MLSCFSHVRLFAAPCTVAHQAPLFRRFSRQDYWSGLPCPPPGDLPDSGIKPTSLKSSPLAARFFTTSTTWEALLSLGFSHAEQICSLQTQHAPFSSLGHSSAWSYNPTPSISGLASHSLFKLFTIYFMNSLSNLHLQLS